MSLSIQALLKKYGIIPKKRLGQHFLTAMPTVEKIVNSLEISRDDIVIEIGPGLGLMTRLVAKRALRVIAIEHDKGLLEIAKEELADLTNITWVEGDVLEQSIAALTHGKRCAVIGNLPYNISSPILFWMLDQRELISRAIVMLQKEVAVRMAAAAGGKEYGVLSVLLQAFASCKRLFDVSAKSFIPPPEVTSSVIRISFDDTLHDITDEAWFRRVVKTAFGRRRKTIRNSLMGGASAFPEDAVDKALALSNIDARRRPETLSIKEFVKLARALQSGLDNKPGKR